MSRPEWRMLRDAFLRRFGPGAMRVFFAPGRVNLIGEHVDYNGGVVLPVAIDLGMFAAVRARADGLLRVASMRRREQREIHCRELAELRPERAWYDYPLGALRALDRQVPLERGADLMFLGTVPPGAGLSSSAALLVATLFAVATAAEIELGREAIARLAFLAETEFVGVRCGRMDQMVSALGEPGHALLIDFRFRSDRREIVPLPVADLSLLVFDSKTRHQLTAGGYNERVAESQSALALLRQNCPGLEHLGHLTPADLERTGAALPELERRRARHVVSEVERVVDCARALGAGDLVAAGRLINASHASCRDDYQVSTVHLDTLQEAAVDGEGVFGARLTGAGFGGCILALTRRGAEGAVITRVVERYRRRFGMEPTIHRLAPAGGLHEEDEEVAG